MDTTKQSPASPHVQTADSGFCPLPTSTVQVASTLTVTIFEKLQSGLSITSGQDFCAALWRPLRAMQQGFWSQGGRSRGSNHSYACHGAKSRGTGGEGGSSEGPHSPPGTQEKKAEQRLCRTTPTTASLELTSVYFPAAHRPTGLVPRRSDDLMGNFTLLLVHIFFC